MLFSIFLSILSTSVSFRQLPSASASPLVRVKNIITWKIKIYILISLNILDGTKRYILGSTMCITTPDGVIYIFSARYKHLANFFQEPSWNRKYLKIWPNRLFFINLDFFWVFLMSFSCYFRYFFPFLALPSASASFHQLPPAH